MSRLGIHKGISRQKPLAPGEVRPRPDDEDDEPEEKQVVVRMPKLTFLERRLPGEPQSGAWI